MKTYYVYIITNHTNSVLYIGITNNIEKRINEHKKGKVKGFSQKYRLYKLVWLQEFADVSQAISMEKKLKGWKRAKKEALIRQQNPQLRNLQV